MGIAAGGEAGFPCSCTQRWVKCYLMEIPDFAVGINIKWIVNSRLPALNWIRRGELRAAFLCIFLWDQIAGGSCIVGTESCRDRLGFCKECLFCLFFFLFLIPIFQWAVCYSDLWASSEAVMLIQLLSPNLAIDSHKKEMKKDFAIAFLFAKCGT